MNAPREEIPTLDLAIEAHDYSIDHAPRVLSYLDTPGGTATPDERRRWVELALARAYTCGAMQGITVARDAIHKATVSTP